MSCRIERLVTEDDGVVLRVSGSIRAEDVDTLRGALSREDGRLAIDLKEVLLVAREAIHLLALSEAKGTELRNCAGYIREWVSRERTHLDLKAGAGEDSDDV